MFCSQATGYKRPTDAACHVLVTVFFLLSNIFLNHLPPQLDGYTFYSVSQERIMDEMDEEARRARLQGPKTGAN